MTSTLRQTNVQSHGWMAIDTLPPCLKRTEGWEGDARRGAGPVPDEQQLFGPAQRQLLWWNAIRFFKRNQKCGFLCEIS